MLDDFLKRRPYNAAADFIDGNVARGLGDKLAFVDPEEPIQLLKNGHRRLADADDADLLRFDERDLHPLAREDACERARGHPTSGAAADDEHAPDRLLLHDVRD